jgi:predicted methyltransferase
MTSASSERDDSRPLIEQAVGHTARPAEDRVRDASSKPAEVLAFLGAAPGMTVLDLHAATGYFTELLAYVVGADGQVIAHNHPGALTVLPPDTFERRFGGGRLRNVEQLFARHAEINLPSGRLDAVLMSLIYHDIYWSAPDVEWGPVDPQALLAGLFDALKPGGVVVVLDHHAESGADPHRSAAATHRIDAAVVRRDFARAGFALDCESDLLRNVEDDYSASVFDPAVLGRTDRFLMRFRRPEWLREKPDRARRPVRRERVS